MHPIALDTGMRAWLVTEYNLAKELLRNPTICKDARTTAGVTARSGAGRSGATTVSRGITAHMLNSDPPRHTRLRHAVTYAFTPQRIENLRPRIERIADDLLDDLEARRGRVTDLIEGYAAPLPITVICELLGVPVADRRMFRQWTNTVIDVVVGDPDEVKQASLDLERYLAELVDQRRQEPRDDLISAMITDVDEADPLSDQELVSMSFLMLVAGHETTVNLIANTVLAVLNGDADQHTALTATHDLIEETLRHNGPVNIATLRYATEPLTIQQHTIAPGELVLIALSAADRDDHRFPDARVFDINRDTQGHLAFGGGIHHCLGANLARMEAVIAVRKLFTRFPDISLPEPVDRWKPSILIRGLCELPVQI
ncbi:cytochrome P450 family protein [Nocardia macrotermitis]|uniref:cytochrome P450 family protein n=1 Tax=Nocardia macrotermitis TaxID=2585198 RepID=UPI0029E806E3|nr:cytochrome P450 [Nocardia macrotermitis]